MSRRTILVDGYNFIGAVSTLRPGRLERDREGLLGRLARYAAVRGHRVEAVFDGAGAVGGEGGRAPHPGVRAVFSGGGEKADDVLKARCRALRGDCVVVTDDHGVRDPCRGAGALVLGCAEFDALLRRSEREPVPERPAEAGGAGGAAGRGAAGRGAAGRGAAGRGAAGRGAPPCRGEGEAAALSAEDLAAWAEAVRDVAAAARPGAAAEAPPRGAVAGAAGRNAAGRGAPPCRGEGEAVRPEAEEPPPGDPWEVTEAILAAKDADEAPVRRGGRGEARDPQRLRRMRDDL